MKSKLHKGDALLIVDPQYDFLPNGSLAISEGDKILPVVNQWLEAAKSASIPIFISRDWHPSNHISFKAQGGPWPAHCVQNTPGAEFHKDLKIPASAIIVNKAVKADEESYSALRGFTAEGNISLPKKLQELKVTRLWIGGLAFDYCVHYSCLEARKLGFAVRVILPATRAIADETEQKSFREMAAAGVEFETDSDPQLSS